MDVAETVLRVLADRQWGCRSKHYFSMFITLFFALAVPLELRAAESPESYKQAHERRLRAARDFQDGILLIHSSTQFGGVGDGFRQDPFFYYFTGLPEVVGAILAIDGKTGESWLFMPSKPPFANFGMTTERPPGSQFEQDVGMDHVVDWSQLETFLGARSLGAPALYFIGESYALPELPDNLTGGSVSAAPAWVRLLSERWPAFALKPARAKVMELMRVQGPDEMTALRSAAQASVAALTAGMKAIRAGVSQRQVETVVESACWKAGAHGTAFWPWVMTGENAVLPRPFASFIQYDHLNRGLKAGDLVRLDVGCEWDHYQGDLGRTVPASRHFDRGQRETWDVFVAAYHAGVRKIRDGATVDQIFDAWRGELGKHRASAQTILTQHAIASWIERKNVPYWEIHTTNLLPGNAGETLRAGTTINFEPIADVDGQAFFLEDMFLVTPDGAELLTPGVPYSAQEIEDTMKRAASLAETRRP